MSNVTNIILTTGLHENEAIESINRRYRHKLREELVRVFSLSHMTHVAGNKELECGVHISAMNGVDMKQLITLIETVAWNSPDEVQLFVKAQDDDRFTQVELCVKE
jgi:hypothetical protein